MMDLTTRVCVIGGGPSGVMATKWCLQYGLSVVCYDERSHIGGIWTGSDDRWASVDADGHTYTAVHDKLHLNTSQFATTFSDFPLPEDLTPSTWSSRRYLNCAEFLEYMRRYASAFGVDAHVRLSSRVVSVKRVADSGDREWEVTVRQRVGDSWEERRSRHEHVIIASGQYTKARIPEFPGMHKTPVKVIHTGHVRDTKKLFQGRRVLVVGGSISAGDMAEAALVAGAEKVTWAVTRSPSARSVVMLQRMPLSRPFAWDEWLTLFGLRTYPDFVRRPLVRKITTFAHRRAPDVDVDFARDRFSVQHVDFLEQEAARGRLEVLPLSLRALAEDAPAATLTDGRALAVDVCVLGTGYAPSYPFLGPSELGPGGLKALPLHHHMVAVTPAAWGLLFLYTTSVTGSGIVATEMEARWLAHQLATGRLRGDARRRELEADADRLSHPLDGEARREHFHTTHSTAAELGCCPAMWPALLAPTPWGRRVGLATALGPWVPQQYRLRGPHAEPGPAGRTLVRVTRAVFGWRFDAAAAVLDILHLGAAAWALWALRGWLRGAAAAWGLVL